MKVHETVRPMGVQSESFFMCNYWLGHYPHNQEKWRMNDWCCGQALFFANLDK
ncbi:MAG: hypothetical protein LBK96_04175 [Prevotellaceae bacterium]|jgi:hypothetical protein|nr:hypothetical protein [Prevotellaceae bacterium]